MSRKEAVNQFSGGLISDLNPITTPNTVLTDCLNGTIITYNGNEYSLQNDKGNYSLKHCKLNPNYIPVGLKEYGDILYIVSYNPLNEHVEVGSYPSPETISDSNDLSGLNETVDEIIASIASSSNYSELVGNKEKLKIFFAADPEKSKLNPGDMYQFSLSNDSENKYELVQYYIIDENKKLYDISDKITVNHSDFKCIEWDVPGWLAIKKHLATLDDFRINVKKIATPSYTNGATLSLNLQAIATDTLITKSTTITSDLKVQINIDVDGADVYNQTIAMSNITDMKNGQIVYYTNCNPDTFTAGANSVITVTATPILQVTPDKTVTYDNLQKTLIFNTSNKGDVNNFKIGESAWWYNTNSEDKTFILKFDTEGLSETSVLDGDVYLFYSLQRPLEIDPDRPLKSLAELPYVTTNNGSNYQNIRLDDWNILGETIVEFPLEEFTSENYTAHPTRMYAEDVYIMTFKFYPVAHPDFKTTPLRTLTKLITATELMNGFKDSCYDTITFDRWMGKYADSVKNKNFIVNGFSPDQSKQIVDTVASYTENYNTWKTGNNKVPKYKAYISSLNDTKFKQGFDVSAGVSCPTSITYGSGVKVLTGPLWLDFVSNMKVVYNLQNTRNITLDSYTGTNLTTYTDTVTSKVNKSRHYVLQQLDDPLTIWNYDVRNLNVPGSDDFKITCFGSTLKDYAKGSITFDSGGIAQQTIATTDNLKDREGEKIFTINSLNNLFHKISNTNKARYDVLFINMRAGGQGSNGWEGSRIWCDGLSEAVTYSSVGYHDGNHGWGPSYADYHGFAVFKVNYKLGFVPLAKGHSYSDFYNWKSDVEHIVCDNTTELRGSFYHAISAGSTSSDNNFKFLINGFLAPSSFNYYGKNLFSTERSSILSTKWVSNLKNFTVAEDSEDSLVGIQPIELDKYEGVIYIPTEFSASIDTLLNNADVAITNYNNQVVDTQRSLLMSDTLYTSEGYTSNSNVYRYKRGAINTNATLIDLLNGKPGTMANTVLQFFYNNVSYSKHYNLKGDWGYLDPSITI